MARNILVVEDDRNISELIRMYLEKEGFEVRLAYDGGKAVEEYDKRAPDMVLLDIMLPVMDGWGVCAHIREKGKTPIIMLTAKSDVGDRITGCLLYTSSWPSAGVGDRAASRRPRLGGEKH